MENRSLVTIAEHSREKILYMLEMAKEFEAHPNRHILDGKVVATLFFEPSTRTIYADWEDRTSPRLNSSHP